MGNAELEDCERPPALGPNGADKAIDYGRLRSDGAASECARHRQRSTYLRSCATTRQSRHAMGPGRSQERSDFAHVGDLVRFYAAGSLRGLVLNSESLQADYIDLVNKCVDFEGPPEKQPWGTVAVFHDPDCNSIVLQQS